MSKKWSRTYWADLGERVASTVVYGLITLLPANAVTDITPELGWTIVGLPAALCVLKGLAANLKDSESGPSMLPSPPAPKANEDGVSDIVFVLGLACLALVIYLIVR